MICWVLIISVRVVPVSVRRVFTFMDALLDRCCYLIWATHGIY